MGIGVEWNATTLKRRSTFRCVKPQMFKQRIVVPRDIIASVDQEPWYRRVKRKIKGA